MTTRMCLSVYTTKATRCVSMCTTTTYYGRVSVYTTRQTCPWTRLPPHGTTELSVPPRARYLPASPLGRVYMFGLFRLCDAIQTPKLWTSLVFYHHVTRFKHVKV